MNDFVFVLGWGKKANIPQYVSKRACPENAAHESVKDFLNILNDQVKPSKGRALRNAMLMGSFDYKQHYDQYNLQVSGLVPNARAKNGDETRVNHCWRFLRRGDTCN